MSKYDAVLKKVQDFSVSSCLTLVYSINGCSITTSEGIGNSKDGFHPIHERFAAFHASQCGFCTPGMCMSLYAALVNAKKTDRPGFSKLTVSEAEKSVSGNLCRCTGYRSIADVCKSFAADVVDIEDLGLPLFNPMNEEKEVSIYDEFMKGMVKSEMFMDFSSEYSWYTPVSIDDLLSLCSAMAKNGKQFKLVVGNTGTGYYKELKLIDRYIDLRYIPQLSIIRKNSRELEIGATLTISRVISILMEDGNLVFKKLAEHMEKVATPFVRNSGSIGGNLILAQRNHFPSDIATILLGAGCTVSIASENEQEKKTMEQFLENPALDSITVLLGIHLPILEPEEDSKSPGIQSKLVFETYRAAPRPLGNALAYLNAAFLADVSYSSTGVVVNYIRLAFGAFGTKHAIRARNVEEYLSGKTLTVRVLYEAVNLVKEAIVPEPGTSYPEYRKSLAVSFLFQFLYPFINNGLPRISHMYNSNDDVSGKTDELVESCKDYSQTGGGGGGEPFQKYLATIQASGWFVLSSSCRFT